MNTWLHIGLSNALAAALLALLALAVGSFWRRPALTHALWLLVLVKLLTPPLVWIPVPWPVVSEAAPDAAPEEPAAPSAPMRVEAESVETLNRPAGPVVIVAEEPAPVERAVEEPAPPAPESEPSASPAALVAVVWLGGTVVWLTLAMVRLHRFQKLLRYARPAAADLQERARKLAGALRLRRCPGVYLLPGRLAPMIWAAGGRPRLLLPVGLAEQLDEKSLDTLLLHELAHLRRRDHWVRGLELLALALYWWHPFVWLARRELREAEEQCCDAWVVASLPGSERTYATALVDALDFLSAAPVAPPLATGLGQVSDLKRRLTMIMRGTTPRTLSWSGVLTVLAVAALLPLLPAWALAQQPKPAAGEEKSTTPERAEYPRIKVVPVEERVRWVRVHEVAADQAQSDVQKAEAELRQKMAEVEAAKARLQDASRRARQRTEGQLGPVLFRSVGTGSEVEIIGLDDKPEIKKQVADLLKKTLPAGRRVIIVCGGGQQAHRILMTPPGMAPDQPYRIELRRETGTKPRPKGDAVEIEIGNDAGTAPRPKEDPRIWHTRETVRPASVEALQKQLEELRREVERLRREMKRPEAAKPETNKPNAPEAERLKDLLKRAQNEALKARDLAEERARAAAAARDAALLEAERVQEQLKAAEKRLEAERKAREARERESSRKP